jgi:hypothetical protein
VILDGLRDVRRRSFRPAVGQMHTTAAFGYQLRRPHFDVFGRKTRILGRTENSYFGHLAGLAQRNRGDTHSRHTAAGT